MSNGATLFLAACALALDPVALFGYVIAGSLIRKPRIAVGVGILWMLILQGAVVRPWTLRGFSSVHLFHTLLAIVFAALVTLVVNLVVSKFLASKQSTVSATLRILLRFKFEWIWRVFLGLQLIGIIGIIYLSITASSWKLFPYTSRGDNRNTAVILTPYLCLKYPSSPIMQWQYHYDRWYFQYPWLQSNSYEKSDIEWDLLDSRYWTHYRYNWLALIALLGPFIVAQFVEWISEARPKQT